MTPMRVVRYGTVEFDGVDLRYDDWIVIGRGPCFASEQEIRHEMRVTVFVELARIAGVALEPRQTDFTSYTCAIGLAAERAAREAIEHARAPRRPWWRFWR